VVRSAFSREVKTAVAEGNALGAERVAGPVAVSSGEERVLDILFGFFEK
jgi:hypothetical protein